MIGDLNCDGTGFFDVAALKASTKVLSKEGFCAVLMRYEFSNFIRFYFDFISI